MQISVIVADDHTLFRKGLISLLSSSGDIVVTGEASNGNELLECISSKKADVILLDISMPGMDGYEVLQDLAKQNHAIRSIVISMHDGEPFIIRAIEAGACGFLSKDSHPDEIIHAIKDVVTGGFHFSERTNQAMIHRLAKKAHSIRNLPAEQVTFSDRETSILTLLCQGETSESIGKKLFISPRTVDGIRSKMIQKAGVKNVIGLCAYAIKYGIVD
jgi:two-component system response regulator DegU